MKTLIVGSKRCGATTLAEAMRRHLETILCDGVESGRKTTVYDGTVPCSYRPADASGTQDVIVILPESDATYDVRSRYDRVIEMRLHDSEASNPLYTNVVRAYAVKYLQRSALTQSTTIPQR